MTQAQDNNSYESLWKQVAALESENLTASALKIVVTISAKATKERNSPQIVKALLYTSKYAMTLEENAQLSIVNSFKAEIATASFPTKNVLESYLANLYWDYFQQNRYQFYNRTKTEEKVDETDFRTWDLTTLFLEIDAHFTNSLKNTAGLQQIPINDFTTLLHRHDASVDYRPTLFDVLAHTALQFYKTSENSITRPADTFEINDPELLCEASAFAKTTIDTSDTSATQARALEIYRELIRFHLTSKKPYTLAEIDIERLQFTRANAIFTNADEHYLEVLQNMVAATKGTPAASLYTYEIAALYQQWGATYDPNGSNEHQWKLKEALSLCESVITDYPKSRGADKCKALKAQLLAPSLDLTNESNIPTNQNSRLLVRYKNHSGLRLSARKITQRELAQLNKLYEQPSKLDFLKKLPITTQWDASLKNENDYQSHSTEIVLPPLPNGQYMLLAEPTNDTAASFAYSPIQVTDFAVVHTQSPAAQLFQVINRTTGAPIKNASVALRYQENYNSPQLSKNFTTDALGMITIPLADGAAWNNVSLTINHTNQTAFYDNYYLHPKNEGSPFTQGHVAFLFTDRSIYRPNQPVFFKGIALQQTLGKSTVLANTKVTVILKDVNYQEVAKQELKTNDFGSFSGEFMLPLGGLTGNFSLSVSANNPSFNASTRFLVEEYKRPKFQTQFTPVTDTYRVNDTITVQGNAAAYAGSFITDAKVIYRVKRTVQYPIWYGMYRSFSPFPQSTPQEITFGETKTDAEGNYEIDFKAIPDAKTDAKSLPIFNYEVTADVTDINGETHTATTTIHVGYHALTAKISIPTQLDASEKQQLELTTNNLNGQFVATQGSLKMYKLTAPSHVLRPRPWAAPDYAGFTQEAFKKLYPNDAFTNEHDFTQWKKGKQVWKTTFNTENNSAIALEKLKNWASGKYVIELETTDKFGQKVTDVAYTTLFSTADKQLPDNQLFHITTDKTAYSIGDTASISLMSNAENLKVTVFTEKLGKIVDTRLVVLTGNLQRFSVPVTANDLGGFTISYSFSAFNAAQTGSVTIAVPYPEKELQIETLTFRDNIKPNTEETWSFKIKGDAGEKISAELLASMYDASLDSFKSHAWQFNPIHKPRNYSVVNTNATHSFGVSNFSAYNANSEVYIFEEPSFDSFNWFGLQFGYGYSRRSKMMTQRMVSMDAEGDMNAASFEAAPAMAGAPMKVGYADNEAELSTTEDAITKAAPQPAAIRKNLQETAFFFPTLQTDKDGNVSFSFTTPEALTQWNLQLLAHTKDLQNTYISKQTVTQKELMVIPNAPRFLREGDAIVISTKIANLSKKELSGLATLELIDAVTGKTVTKELLSATMQELENTPFTVDAMGNTQVSWRLNIPKELQALQYKVIAKAADFSDGEQNLLPVLSNRMLVTETLPMWVRSNQTKTFTLNKLKNLPKSVFGAAPFDSAQGKENNSLKPHKLTLEITSNPAWYAVQALPYLMEYPHDCNEQIFARFYANSLASYIANANPRIQEVFAQWRTSDALISNLEKNAELKSILIQETPWLRDAQSETEQKKRIALLFDLNKLKNEQATALNKLQQNQHTSGAWAWFSGGRDNRNITQHIIAGLGHLNKLTSTPLSNPTSAPLSKHLGGNNEMVARAIAYLDAEFVKEYEETKRNYPKLTDDHLSATQIHYLYMRSFFPDIKKSSIVTDISTFYKGQAEKYWMKQSVYEQGMLALVLHRMDAPKTTDKILNALTENSITSEEQGMYWKNNTASYYWHQAPIETQALLIEAFSEIRPNDIATVDNLKIWLLKNKQTNQWKTTKATTEAVYALLLQGSDWLSVTDAVDVLVGGEKIAPELLENVQAEAGTGYYKTAWNSAEISPKMGEVQLTKKGDGIAWGALYWQYFEGLDKITTSETPLKLSKKLFLKTNTTTGEEIAEITDKTTLQVGDLVRVRIELRADRGMEFIHMKDMRAAGFEPISVLSQYKYQDGLGYYEATKDASTNFFFDYLPKGVFVFEYDLRVNNAGDFSNGITTIQSMYAPEFSSHSEGIRVKVD